MRTQLVNGRPASDIDKSAAPPRDAYGLLAGLVVVDSGGSGAEIWAYQRPSAARHHRMRDPGRPARSHRTVCTV